MVPFRVPAIISRSFALLLSPSLSLSLSLSLLSLCFSLSLSLSLPPPPVMLFVQLLIPPIPLTFLSTFFLSMYQSHLFALGRGVIKEDTIDTNGDDDMEVLNISFYTTLIASMILSTWARYDAFLHQDPEPTDYCQHVPNLMFANSVRFNFWAFCL